MDIQTTGKTDNPDSAGREDFNGDYSATYSPDDNKLRLYSVHRLDDATYQKAHPLGFRYAPKQALFVAPAWSPEREDFLLSLCGEIGDDDRTLLDRAEERSDRFSDYQISRTRDAERAHAAARAISDHIPLGQPILAGITANDAHAKMRSASKAGCAAR